MSAKLIVAALSVVVFALATEAQTLRHDPEALDRVRRGSESDGEYLSRLLSESVTSLRGNQASCTQHGSFAAPSAQSQQDKKRQNEKICALIEPLNPDSQLQFTSTGSGNLCTPFWKGGKAPWEHNPKLWEQINSYSTKNFVPPSRDALLKQGFTVMNRDEEQAYHKKVEELRDRAASFCCDSMGTEAAECTQAMRDVKIEICRDEASDKDPSRPDSCAAADGVFHRSQPDSVQILKQMIRDGSNARQVQKSVVESANKQFGQYLESSEVKALNIVPGEKVVSGKMILSPYRNNAGPKAGTGVIAHEFMHACSMIRKQLDIKHNSLFASSAMQATMLDHMNSCDVAPATVEAYGGHLSHFKMDGASLSGCLTKLALKSIDPKSSVYVPNACARKKVEEGFAEAMAIFLAEPAVPAGFPDRACNLIPSTAHPHPTETVKCMIASLPSYKKLVQEAFKCPVSPQQ